MDELILDTLYPPTLYQLLQDMAAVGATGVAVYVWRPGGTGSWTPALAQGVRDTGKKAFPIIVPAVDGGDINGQLGAAQAFGFTSGPITLDLEPPNLPPAAWEESFDRAAAANGFQDFDYGTPSNLGQYAPDDQNWVATWIRTGQLNPLPVRPPGWAGWQFVNDITINGRVYDASVIASSVFGGLVHSPGEVDMILVTAPDGSGHILYGNGILGAGIDTASSGANLAAAGLGATPAPVDDDTWAKMQEVDRLVRAGLQAQVKLSGTFTLTGSGSIQ